MSRRFEELDWRPTPLGELTLRRRRDPVTGADVHEVKLGDAFLMSSLFTAGEVALAELGLSWCAEGALDVAVGGLGLGHTAAAVLEDTRVRSVLVLDALGEVIEWHRRGLVPLGARLTADSRLRFAHRDFFAAVAGPDGLDPEESRRRFDAVLLDVDHSPRHVLHERHASFYEPAGMRRLAESLRPGGVFALWSDDPPDEQFTSVLADVFAAAEAHVVDFDNPLRGGASSNTVYLARKHASSAV